MMPAQQRGAAERQVELVERLLGAWRAGASKLRETRPLQPMLRTVAANEPRRRVPGWRVARGARNGGRVRFAYVSDVFSKFCRETEKLRVALGVAPLAPAGSGGPGERCGAVGVLGTEPVEIRDRFSTDSQAVARMPG